MTFENKDMSNETERFNYALDLFFGMNPAKRYWILLALYFAKNKKLQAIDNYEGNDLIMASMSIDLIGHRNIVEEWNQKGSVLEWIIKREIEKDKTIVVEWYFKCDYQGKVSGFDGVTIADFNKEGKIFRLKEFRSDSEHIYPYE